MLGLERVVGELIVRGWLGPPREVWMCKSTDLLVGVAHAVELLADVALYGAKHLQRRAEARFRAYVTEANAAYEAIEREEGAAGEPSSQSFEDPQHGGKG